MIQTYVIGAYVRKTLTKIHINNVKIGILYRYWDQYYVIKLKRCKKGKHGIWFIKSKTGKGHLFEMDRGQKHKTDIDISLGN